VSWPLVELGSVLKVVGGYAFKSKEFVEDGFPIIRITNIDGINVNLEKAAKVPEEIIKGKERFRVNSGDILIAMSGATTGKLGVVPERVSQVYLNQRVGKFDFDSIKLHNKFLYYFLLSDVCQTQINALAAGAAQPNISGGQIESIMIPLPPLTVQKQIAAALEKSDTLRGQCQKMEQELNTLAQSVFLELFGDPVSNPNNWELKKLKDIVSIQSGATPSKANDSFWKGDFPWVSPKDMKSTYISNSIDHISESVFKETNLKRISINTILIVVRGMILVHTVPLAMTTKDVSINQDIKAMKVLDDSLEPLYLLWCLKSQHDHILGKVSTAAHGTKRLDMPDLVGLDICIPPQSIQQKFVEIIRKLDEQLTVSKTSVSDHESIFNSLMQRAFKGELEFKDVA
jgi:type I restriction enzyme S subunit